jgi:hypothetical protein
VLLGAYRWGPRERDRPGFAGHRAGRELGVMLAVDQFDGPCCVGALKFVKCVHIDPQFRKPSMETSKVGIREFRADLAEYIASSTPVAVTRHGQTVGYFIPTLAHGDADLVALKTASKALDQMLAAKGVDVDALVADFKLARARKSNHKKPKAAAA